MGFRIKSASLLAEPGHPSKVEVDKIWRWSEGKIMQAPSAIQKIGDVLAIAWPDGREDYVELRRIREACPCASCQGETDVTGRHLQRPVPTAPPSFELVGWQFVGGYGWQPRWADGHSTGIFTFDFLRKVAEDALGSK